MIISQAKMVQNNIKSRSTHIVAQVRYCARTESMPEGEALRPIATNCAGHSSDEIISEMDSLASLRPDLKKITDQVILSPEAADREMTAEEWQRAIDIYRQQRGLGDAPYVAYLHTDGNKERHPHHVHLLFLRAKSDGSTVSDSWDSSVNRAASRRIERELGLTVNAGADESQKYNGRNKDVQRQRAAERRNEPIERSQVDADVVARCIDQSRNINQLRENLRATGIEMRVRRRGGQIYAWSLRNIDGPKEWTSGSKLAASNDFGWGKVQARLDQNFADRERLEPKKHPRRARGLRTTQRPLQQPRSLDESVDRGAAAALKIMQELMAAARSSPATRPAQPARRHPNKRPSSRQSARPTQRG